MPTDPFANLNELMAEHGLDYQSKPTIKRAVLMDTEFYVQTLEGTMHGKAGDYLVRGISGEFYPCDRGIFEQSYSPVVPVDPEFYVEVIGEPKRTKRFGVTEQTVVPFFEKLSRKLTAVADDEKRDRDNW